MMFNKPTIPKAEYDKLVRSLKEHILYLEANLQDIRSVHMCSQERRDLIAEPVEQELERLNARLTSLERDYYVV